MWVLSWTKYSSSKFATFVSIIGAFTRYGGVICLFSSLVVPGLICLAIGIGIHFLANLIAKKKEEKKVAQSQAAPSPAQATVNANKQTTVNAAAQPRNTDFSATTNTSTEMIRCSNCGFQMPKGSRFCKECGSPIQIQQPNRKKCIRCGEALNENSKFCSNCGYPVKHN